MAYSYRGNGTGGRRTEYQKIGSYWCVCHLIFRDTFATRCVESGMQPKTLQAILGHSSISMTMDLYVHCLDDTKVRELKAVSFK